MTEIRDVTFRGQAVENRGSVSQLSGSNCPICATPMKRYVIKHTNTKMATIVSCPNHPLVCWEDVFDKAQLGQQVDWTNVDKRFPEAERKQTINIEG